MEFEKVQKEILNHRPFPGSMLKQQKERFCAKSHILCKKEIFSAESKKYCAKVNLSGKNNKGFTMLLYYDIMLKDGDLQTLSKVGLNM